MRSLVLPLALVGLSSPASQVSWDAPTGCLSRSAIVSGVEALLGGSLDAERPVVVRAEGRIEPLAGDRWTLSLAISSETGTRERTLEGTTCQELGEIAIVLIAVAIDPSVEIPEVTPMGGEEAVAVDEIEEANEREVLDESEDADELVGADPPVAAPEEDTEKAKSPRRSLTGFVGVSTGLLVGPLPGVAPGVHLDLGSRWRMLAVSVGVSHWFERRDPDVHPAPEVAIGRFAAAKDVERFLDELDEDKREVFILAEIEGMTAPEIAEAIGVNVNTVYARLRAARLRFERRRARDEARERREAKACS